VDPSIDQQVPYVLNVGVFRDADDCRGHDVVCSGASRCDEQVVLADQTDNAAVAIDDRDGADPMLIEGRRDSGDAVIGLHHDDGCRHDLRPSSWSSR